MSPNDPLEGFRGPTEPGTPSPEEDPAEKLRERLGEDAHLVSLVEFSAEMERFCEEHPVGRYIYAQCAKRTAAATQVIFSHADLKAEKVQAAHFDGRVALAVLKLFDEAILAGQEAARTIAAADGSADGE